jgi:RNA polymerase sigma factor (sigma-70 family)
MLSAEDGAAVRKVIDVLPAPLREGIVLREFNRMPYAEIADVVGVSVETVISRLARGRHALLLAACRVSTGEPEQQSIAEAP